MAKIKNTGFFKQADVSDTPVAKAVDSNTQPAADTNIDNNAGAEVEEQNIQRPPVNIKLSPQLLENVHEAATKLNEIGFQGLAKDMARLYSLSVNKQFTVAFVGEFSRGKSTLINNLLGKDILPTSNLPTTALLTKIGYGATPKIIVYGKNGKKVRESALNPNAWDELTAANFGEKEPEGFVEVEYNDPWLSRNGITLLDTPGAGDLEEKRAQIIERCMVNADGAIITIDATKPLSLTEQSFINQKIMSRGVPFMAMALTKLDLVKEEERAAVVSFLLKKLKSLNTTMPIIIPDDKITIPGLDADNAKSLHIGINKIKGLIVAWMTNENRRNLLERWLSINAMAIINSARAFLQQQQTILDAKDVEKEKLIRKRNTALSEMHSKWNELRTQMEERCNKCFADFKNAAKEAGYNIVENLQHEVDRQANQKEWLEKEYAYRVKRELSAISLSLDNLVAKHLAADVRWLNGELSKQFKEIVGVELEPLMSREEFKADVDENAIKLDNLKDKSIKATVLSSVLTIGTAMLLGVAGGAPLILATMGVGTGAGIISKKMLEKESDKQKSALKQLIAEQVPVIIENATHDSGTKIKIIYNDIISESYNTETRWMNTQKSLIRASVENKAAGDPRAELAKRIDTIDKLSELF